MLKRKQHEQPVPFTYTIRLDDNGVEVYICSRRGNGFILKLDELRGLHHALPSILEHAESHHALWVASLNGDNGMEVDDELA